MTENTREAVHVRKHIRPPRKLKADRKIGFYTKLAPDLRAAMRRYKAATWIPEAVQIDLAMRAWLVDKPEAWGVPTRTPTKKKKKKKKADDRARVRRWAR